MERVIKDMELYNMRASMLLGSIHDITSDGRIVAADNFGTQDITVHWSLDTRGETREYINSSVKPIELRITILSDAYDSESRLGDKMYVALYRVLDSQHITNRLYGILSSIERDRFERNDSTLYSTSYTLYVDNPLWRYGEYDYPVSGEEGQMHFVSLQADAITTTQTTLTYTLRPYHTNVIRGVKLVFTPSFTSATYPFDIEFTINGYTFPVTVTSAPTDIIFVFGESIVYCNCEIADKGAVRTHLLDGYGDYSVMHIEPVQWGNNVYTVSYRAMSEVTGIMQASLYMIQGEYF